MSNTTQKIFEWCGTETPLLTVPSACCPTALMKLQPRGLVLEARAGRTLTVTKTSTITSTATSTITSTIQITQTNSVTVTLPTSTKIVSTETDSFSTTVTKSQRTTKTITQTAPLVTQTVCRNVPVYISCPNGLRTFKALTDWELTSLNLWKSRLPKAYPNLSVQCLNSNAVYTY